MSDPRVFWVRKKEDQERLGMAITLTEREIIIQMPGHSDVVEKLRSRIPFLETNVETARFPLERIKNIEIHPYIDCYKVKINEVFCLELDPDEFSALMPILYQGQLRVPIARFRPFNPTVFAALIAILSILVVVMGILL
jgi:hypothetical protein